MRGDWVAVIRHLRGGLVGKTFCVSYGDKKHDENQSYRKELCVCVCVCVFLINSLMNLSLVLNIPQVLFVNKPCFRSWK